MNTSDRESAYEDYLLKNDALRFSRSGKFIPNIEMKFPKLSLDDWTLKNRMKVLLNSSIIFISPLELQIPFKLYLGSEKDIEDARFLYKLFRDNLNTNLLTDFIQKLKIEVLANKYL